MVTSNAVHDVDQLKRLNIPLVLLASETEDTDCDTLELDNYIGAYKATLHLADGSPLDRCMFVGGPATNRDAQRRAAAFRAALEERGHIAASDQVHHGRWSFRCGWNWAGRMLEQDRLAGTAVLAGNDEIAVGIGHRAKDAGLSIPGDVRIVGFDDSRSCPFLNPPLSSVRVPNRQIGAEAVTALIRRLTEGETNGPMRHRIETSLVIRESSTF